MVFNANLVAVIKQNGKILRETKNDGRYNTNNQVYIPFGSEYTILLKNLNTRKALVTVEIDGREAISDLIIHPNSNVELERFFEGNMNKGHKFKFIEKTDDIKNHRGDKIEDGIVRITYQFEQPNYWYTYTISGYDWSNDIPRKNKWAENLGPFIDHGSTGGTIFDNNITYTSAGSNFFDQDQMIKDTFDQIRSFNCCDQVNEDGITVEGGYSDQSFIHGNIGILDPEVHCINIELKGQYPNKGEVKRSLTTKMKTKCDYCGKLNNSKNKFCPTCGAALI